MDFQDILMQTLPSIYQRQIYERFKGYLGREVEIEAAIIEASQRILYDEEEAELPRETIKKLYKRVFGVEYIGEIPSSSALKKSLNNLENNSTILKEQPSLLKQLSNTSQSKENKQYKNTNSEVKLLDRSYNRKYYDQLQISEGRLIYKSKCKKKYFLMDVYPDQHWPNRHALKLLFTIFTSNEREEFYQHLITLAQMFIFSFEAKASAFLKSICDGNLDLCDILIEGEEVLSLLLNRIYHQVQKRNLQHRALLYSTKTLKQNYTHAFFTARRLTYNNTGYYLDDFIKTKIVNGTAVSFEEFISSLSFQEEVMEIIKYSKVNGFYQSPSRRWKITVDTSLDIIELTFLKDMSQVLGAKDKDDRAVLDLYAMAVRKSDIPSESIRNFSSKHFKSQKTLTLQKIEKPKQQQDTTNESSNNLCLFELTDVSSIDYNDFEFNVLEFNTQGTVSLAYQLLSERFVPTLGINRDTLKEFVKQIGANYDTENNAFHNIYHAFTVLHGAYIVSKGEVFVSLFDQDVTLAYLIAAYCHDVCHTGVTNFFQEKTVSSLANRYGDISILENNSIGITFKILAKSQADFMSDFSEKVWKNFRRIFVESILATDNKNHLHVLTNFESVMNEKSQTLEPEDVYKLIGGLLHTVDFWGTIKGFKLSYAWSQMINQEFDNQFKKQAELELQQTPYFKDLDKIQVIAKNQQVFVSAIVLPLYKRVNEWSRGGLALALKRVDENIAIWKKIQTGEEKIEHYI